MAVSRLIFRDGGRWAARRNAPQSGIAAPLPPLLQPDAEHQDSYYDQVDRDPRNPEVHLAAVLLEPFEHSIQPLIDLVDGVLRIFFEPADGGFKTILADKRISAPRLDFMDFSSQGVTSFAELMAQGFSAIHTNSFKIIYISLNVVDLSIKSFPDFLIDLRRSPR
jgi:hypothetical protein